MTLFLSHRYRRDGLLLSAGLAVLVALAVLPPFVSGDLSRLLMAAFSPVCHQLADRSFHVDGVQMAVCHRCLGAYVGLLTGVLLFLVLGTWPQSWRPLTVLALAALPGVMDWGGNVLGWWVNTPLSRVSTGAFFGILAGCLLASAVLGDRRGLPVLPDSRCEE